MMAAMIKHSRPWAAPFLFATLALMPLGIGLARAASPPGSTMVAAVFPPWWSAEHAYAAAGAVGRVRSLGAFASVVLVQLDSGAGAARLRESGAWFLLQPELLGGCLSEGVSPRQESRA